MLVEITERNIAKNLAYQKVPDLVAAIRRSNMITIVKELYETGGMTKSEYHDILRRLLNAEGYRE